MRTISLCIFVICFSSSIFARTPVKKKDRAPTQLLISCQVARWPFSADVNSINARTLSEVPRNHLYAYLFHELSQPASKRITGLASKLFWFLKNSEPSTNKMTMVEALEHAYRGDDGKLNLIPERELCNLWEKVSL